MAFWVGWHTPFPTAKAAHSQVEGLAGTSASVLICHTSLAMKHGEAMRWYEADSVGRLWGYTTGLDDYIVI